VVFSVIPAKAGIQGKQELLDPGDPVPAEAGNRGDAFPSSRPFRFSNIDIILCVLCS